MERDHAVFNVKILYLWVKSLVKAIYYHTYTSPAIFRSSNIYLYIVISFICRYLEQQQFSVFECCKVLKSGLSVVSS